jgi:hypothetical protein
MGLSRTAHEFDRREATLLDALNSLCNCEQLCFDNSLTL